MKYIINLLSLCSFMFLVFVTDAILFGFIGSPLAGYLRRLTHSDYISFVVMELSTITSILIYDCLFAFLTKVKYYYFIAGITVLYLRGLILVPMVLALLGVRTINLFSFGVSIVLTILIFEKIRRRQKRKL